MTIQILIHNRYRINRGRERRGRYAFDDPVSQASLFLLPINDPSARLPIGSLTQTPLAITNRFGRARVDMPDQNGSYILRVVPEHYYTKTVGPSLGDLFTSIPSRVYRPLDITIVISGDPGNRYVTRATTRGGDTDGMVNTIVANEVKLLLQPVWITDHTGRRSPRSNIDLIVLHLTGGSSPFGATRTIADHAGAHYLILKNDGQVIKFLRESITGGHAGSGGRSGRPHWKGNTNINQRSIGIEMENVQAEKVNPDFSENQYKSLLRLLKELVSIHSIDPRRIIGHSDVAVELDIKVWDPGLRFDWPRLDMFGFGLKGPGTGYPTLRNYIATGGSEVYGGLFKSGTTHPELRLGDNDGTGIYGGKRRIGITGNPILDLITDLQNIGYWVGPNGATNRLTNTAIRAAMHFQHHFFAMTRSGLPQQEANVRIDGETAMMIYDSSRA